MKNTSIAFLLLFVLPFTAVCQRSMLFKTALDEAFVSANFRGNEDSPHYYNPINLEVVNNESEVLTLIINTGQILYSENPDVQDIIITRGEEITLNPQEKKTISLYGMCIQEFNAAPDANAVYELGEMATGNLKTLAERIRKEEAYGIAGQQAIWALTNGRPIAEINSMDIAQTSEARGLVMDLIDSDTITVAGETIRRPQGNGLIKRSMEGKFEYRLSKESKVHIALFNEDNIVLDELFYDDAVAPGEHKFDYALDHMIDPKQYYYVRLIIDGEIKINFEMKPRS
ncbi:hypothetical protein [Gilvibacter sediminis]|uniref:hypothetical protein n=1 Tax=Gilvibacter sediminis TaxID=379071 RepID=UPI002350778A|nr:hypothetical protein [Gilvibacter sediminis]MDC7997537.1 hypothetical protein [Gilvibacter sediminis]